MTSCSTRVAYRAAVLAALVAVLDGCAADRQEPAAPSSPFAKRPRAEAADGTVAPAGYPQQAPKKDLPAEAPDPAAPPPPGSSTTTKSQGVGARQPVASRDLVIYTARFTMAVYQVDQGIAQVEKIAAANGGYLGQKKDREITIRVPRQSFEPTVTAIDKLGDVLHREIQAEDVTDEHVDLEIRIANARAMQHRLTELLARANVKDALEIEKELHRITEELERMEGRMKVLRDKIAFSTVTVMFEPRGSTLQTARVRLPFGWLGNLNLPSLLSLTEDK